MSKFIFLLFFVLLNHIFALGAFIPKMSHIQTLTRHLTLANSSSNGLIEHRIDIIDIGQSTGNKCNGSNNMAQSCQYKSVPVAMEHRIDIPTNLIIEYYDGDGQQQQMDVVQQLSTTPRQQQQEKLVTFEAKQQQTQMEDNYLNSNSHPLEHRIDIPEPDTFLEQFESAYMQKIIIPHKNAIELLKLVQELSLDLVLPKFYKMSIDLQLYVIYTKIVLILKENHHKIGDGLIGISNNFFHYCRQINDVGGSRAKNYSTISYQKTGADNIIDTTKLSKRLCFLGMFVSLAELLSTKMTAILEEFIPMKHIHRASRVKQNLRQPIGESPHKNVNEGTHQFLDGLNAWQLIDLQNFLTFYSMSIEQLFMFWMNAKNEMTYLKPCGKNKRKYSFSEKAKRHLNELTRENLTEFVAEKVDLEGI